MQTRNGAETFFFVFNFSIKILITVSCVTPLSILAQYWVLRPSGWTLLHCSAPAVFQPVFLCKAVYFFSLNQISFGHLEKKMAPKEEELQEADREPGQGLSKHNNNWITTAPHWLCACWGNLLPYDLAESFFQALWQVFSIEARLS